MSKLSEHRAAHKRHFLHYWKSSLEIIYSFIQMHLGNFRNGNINVKDVIAYIRNTIIYFLVYIWAGGLWPNSFSCRSDETLNPQDVQKRPQPLRLHEQMHLLPNKCWAHDSLFLHLWFVIHIIVTCIPWYGSSSTKGGSYISHNATQ